MNGNYHTHMHLRAHPGAQIRANGDHSKEWRVHPKIKELHTVHNFEATVNENVL